MHLFREEVIYRAVVDDVLEIPKNADTRDTEAIKRLCTGLLKLLFPNVRRVEDLNVEEFEKYCLQTACNMRGVIKTQLGIMDYEFRGKDIPCITIKESVRGRLSD